MRKNLALLHSSKVASIFLVPCTFVCHLNLSTSRILMTPSSIDIVLCVVEFIVEILDDDERTAGDPSETPSLTPIG